MNKKISVVIAALNEAPRIAEVLKVVTKSPLISEVIVVNDGSTDNTSGVVKKFDVILIENQKNIGKTLSVKKGIEKSRNDIIMLLDADLRGLTQESIDNLAEPVMDGRVDWTLSWRDNAFKIMQLLKMELDSGERVIPKKLLADPLIWSRPNVSYGLETLMNKSLLDNNKTFRSVHLRGVINIKKATKIGFIGGWVEDFKMLGQISEVIPLHKFVWQFLKMAYLNKKYSNPEQHP
ncbi:MAG: glycosyltransferase family 2 protein [Candidatus Saccharibacteria bacterium]|nr:glycosyltransferase family 2 protein [Candidatus Saccharibacteria bacterium]